MTTSTQASLLARAVGPYTSYTFLVVVSAASYVSYTCTPLRSFSTYNIFLLLKKKKKALTSTMAENQAIVEMKGEPTFEKKIC
jgi:hypothetical protein